VGQITMGCKKKFVQLLVLVFACANVTLAQTGRERCLRGSTAIHKQFQNFTVGIEPFHDATDGDMCRAVVRNARKTVFTTYNWGLEVTLLGQDVNGDGYPDLVLEGYSGGAHCCWTYYIVSLGPLPRLIREIDNERGAGFVRDSSGRIEIRTNDGKFDYLFLSHAESPFPAVYLRLIGTRLIEVGREHTADYDHEIDKAKRELSPAELHQIRSAVTADEFYGNDSNRSAATKILQIVYAYLYSGRQAQAHQALTEMWPTFDQEAAWKKILEARRKGILRYTSSK